MTAAKIDATGSFRRKNYGTAVTQNARPERARTSGSVEEFVLSQEDSPASEIHRIVRYFMHKMTLL